MKLSTKGRYGVTAMFDLAVRYGQGPISIKEISDRQGISEPYLEQLFSSLRKSGLVTSIRGAQGGYILARHPKDITVGEVIRVLEGPIAPTDCVLEEDPVLCKKSDICVTREIWAEIRDSISKVIDNITLLDMVEKYKQKLSNDAYMFYI
ncbi:RrF2 family transcriptional regulator [Garciella nitratireducens]|uniref:RrF2 family transcriptional regulator n=1 Tax=Garciella nitratireducens TaxID=218205 RepID=UPI000DEA384D|nr:Rrf2 family transcriptional regulator [Garciella nitratireducens]RBP45533.1 BadM/Rrf2 family transcriptional regulator [Garciella nitratireducens]